MNVNTPRRSLFAALFVSAAALGGGCLGGAPSLPAMGPRGPLSPGEAPLGLGRSATAGPLEVAFGAPRGAITNTSQITLVMNKPMRALDIAGQEAPPFASIKPSAAGRWQWVGTSGLTFVPEGRLPRATAFVVEVPAGARALDGTTLAKPYQLELSTERPGIAKVVPSAPPERLDPKATFHVQFNQPVADAEAARGLTLTAAGARIAFDLRRPDPKDGASIDLIPRSPLPLASDITLRASADLRGTEGPLLSGEASSHDFKTYGPLTITHAGCSYDGAPCSPGDESITIQFTNRVTAADALKAVVIDPPAKMTADAYDEDDGSGEVWLRLKLAPSTKYKLRVRAGLADAYGQPLAADFEKILSVRPLDPDAQIAVKGNIFTPDTRRDLPLASVNLSEMELVTAPLTQGGILELYSVPDEYGGKHWVDPPFDAIAGRGGAARAVLKPSAASNALWKHLLRVDDLLSPKDHRGVFAAALRYKRPDDNRPQTTSTLIQVTDLALSAKVSRFGTLVRVTRISTAAPIAGADVTVRRPGATSPPPVFRTDTEGFVTIPASSFRPSSEHYNEDAILFAAVGEEWTFRRLANTVSLSSLWPDLDEPPAVGLIFPDRPIYRPGDVVHLKGMFRREGPLGVGLTTPTGSEITLKVRGPGGFSTAETRALTAFGTVHADVKIPADAELGYYRVEVATPGFEFEGRAAFSVAEYRANEASVTVTSDKSAYVRGDEARFTARGEYLFGAPVSFGEARTTIQRKRSHFTPPGLDERFVAEDSAYWGGLPEGHMDRRIAATRGQLSAEGKIEANARLDMPKQRGPEVITCDVEVTDTSRQAVAEQAEVIVHPAEFYIAMRPPRERLVPAGRELRPEVLAVDPSGSRVAGVAVTVELIERTWVAKNEPGRSRAERVATDKVAASCVASSGEAPASCALAPRTPGYFIVRATAKDRRGNTAAASASVYVLGDGEPSWSTSSGMTLDIEADKPMYDVGQTARLLVKSPFPAASALITVERGGVMSRRTAALTGRAPIIEIPITDEMWPNAYVSVALFRPPPSPGASKPASGDVPAGAAAFRIGYAEIALNPDRRKLNVALKPTTTTARPGSPIDIDVEVKDRAGAPVRAEVTLYAVDEGVLSLAEDIRPDPLAAFAAHRRLGVATVESREDLARVLDPAEALFGSPTVRMGATSVSREPRADFRTVAYYNPTLITGSNGRAHVSFKLPDGLTTYRLTAVVVAEDDRAGRAEGKITASLPLMARPALPRFFRLGDAAEAGVVITSKLPKKARVEVEARVQGLTITGESTRVIDVDPGQSSEVRFPLSPSKLGAASLHFEARSGDASDAVSVKRDVRLPGAVEAVALYGKTDATTEERIGDLSAIRPDVGGLDVQLSSSALVGIDAGFEQLLEYPYGCTEQLTSRLLPLVALRELARETSVVLPADMQERIAYAIREIARHQQKSGGFGLWERSPEVSVWVTAYALFGLLEAQRLGARVPPDVIERATKYLRGQIDFGWSDASDRAVAAFVVDVLAGAAGKGSPPAELRAKAGVLYAERAKMPLFAKAILAHAMVKLGAESDRIDRITAELEGSLRLDGPVARAIVDGGEHFPELLDSDTRTSALVLRALLAARSTHPMASRLAMGILADRRGGAFRTTQEAAFSLIALDLYRRAEEKSAPDFLAHVSFGGRDIAEAAFQGRSAAEVKKTVPAAALVGSAGSPLVFSKNGEGSLFYQARLRYIPRAPSKDPLDRGFFLKKTLRPIRAEDLPASLASTPAGGEQEKGPTVLHGGDLVLAEIVVVTPSPRQYVVIDDPLPAGLEPVDTGLASTSDWLREALRGGGRGVAFYGAGSYSTAWAREELRDDRALFFLDRMPAGMYRYQYLARATTLGTFVAPPARAEEMYTPEIFGRSAANVVEIAPR